MTTAREPSLYTLRLIEVPEHKKRKLINENIDHSGHPNMYSNGLTMAYIIKGRS